MELSREEEYLLVDEVRPEAGVGPFIGVGGKQRGATDPHLVNVLDDDERFTDGLAVMDEYRNLLVNRI